MVVGGSMQGRGDTYGTELILDLHDCDPKKFRRPVIRQFFAELCDLIGMQRSKLCWWDDVGVPPAERQTEPHLKGTSAVQFILTSSITLHALDLLGSVYINIFSCKDFDPDEATEFCRSYFAGRVKSAIKIQRH